jgi:hypothetical protein
MKQYIAISVHSFIDVITNSSTELFVCNTEKTIEAVKEALVVIMNKFRPNEETCCFEQLSEMFDDPYIYTKEMHEEGCKDGLYWKYQREENIGKVIIQGAYDNSIPYEMFNFIEEVFNTSSEHLG